MPLTEDQKALAFASILPGACGLVSLAAFATDKTDFWSWYKDLKRPCWAIPGKCATVAHTVIDMATIVPLAHATTLVWKHGGGWDKCDTRHALIHYGLTFAIGLGFIPLMKKKSLKGCTYTMAGMLANSLILHHLYYNINEKAGWLVLPFCLSSTYYTLMIYRMWDMNEE